MDSSCQYCREQNLGYDRTDRSCPNCKQNGQHYSHHSGESSKPGHLWDNVWIETGLGDRPWTEPLGMHLQQNRDRGKKPDLLGRWLLKSKRGNFSAVDLRNEAMINAEEPKIETNQETLPRQDSLAPPKENSVPLIENNTLNNRSSLTSLSTISLAPCHSRNEHTDHSGHTVTVGLSAESSRITPKGSLDLVEVTTSPLAAYGSQETCLEQFHEILHDISYSSTQQGPGNYHVDTPRFFYCLFCFECFDTQESWAEHESSRHFLAQRFWTCMPSGSIEYTDDGGKVCVFCLAVGPDAEHCAQHKVKRCFKTKEEDRTYRNKLEFECHLEIFHNQNTLNERIENWSHPPADDHWYWLCGFCDEVMPIWAQRVGHLSDHFRKGIPISSWNLLISSCPINKNTGAPVTWFSPLERYRRILYTLQVNELKEINRNPTLAEQYRCHRCQYYFKTKHDAQRHEELWHLPHSVWLCPTKADIRAAIHLQTGPLALYMFPETSYNTQPSKDKCPYCGMDTERQSDSDFNYDPLNWNYRVDHLKSAHNFDTCHSDLRFYRPEQFLLHLASSHNLHLGKWMKDVVESCRREVYMLDGI